MQIGDHSTRLTRIDGHEPSDWPGMIHSDLTWQNAKRLIPMLHLVYSPPRCIIIILDGERRRRRLEVSGRMKRRKKLKILKIHAGEVGGLSIEKRGKAMKRGWDFVTLLCIYASSSQREKGRRILELSGRMEGGKRYILKNSHRWIKSGAPSIEKRGVSREMKKGVRFCDFAMHHASSSQTRGEEYWSQGGWKEPRFKRDKLNLHIGG